MASRRLPAFLLTLVLAAVATLFGGAPAAATPPAPLREPAGACSVEEWRNPAMFDNCVGRLENLSQQRIQCLEAPTPAAPDSGMAGWFASRPEVYDQPGPKGIYTRYGYAGYSFTTYDIGCVPTVMHPDYKFENTIANGEFLIATSIIGASNALRERAWNPKAMWGWADPLVERSTKAVYQKVFTVFGAVTLAIVGLYLLWRSRQSDLSNAMTTAAWAVFVMVAITAIASWPTWSANVADKTLIGSLSVIHEAVGPPPQTAAPQTCPDEDAEACRDRRPPALRASDTAADGMLYRQWLRGTFGSAESDTAKKYGPVLYDAKSLSWDDQKKIRERPELRQQVITAKQTQWMKVAEQIKADDPEAYEYLQGGKGMDRIGAGFIAILSAAFFAMFDITASVLVLLGFLIFRWAVVAAPILGTLGLLRPASAGLRRLANAVIAAVFNIIIFGTGAAIYLFAVDLIMSTASLPGWLQVVLIWMTGVVGWLLLRPYRRITQLGGKDSTETVTSAGSWHRRFFRDARAAAALQVVEPGGTAEPAIGKRRGAPETVGRPESRTEEFVVVAAEGGRASARPEHGRPTETPPLRRAESARWSEPDVPESPSSYAVYRPGERSSAPQRRPESTAIPR